MERQNFVGKLFDVASHPDNFYKLSFNLEGTAIEIYRAGRQPEFLLEKFGFDSYSTLTRNMNYYGFSNMHNSSKREVKIYANANFLRAEPERSRLITRRKSKRVLKESPSPSLSTTTKDTPTKQTTAAAAAASEAATVLDPQMQEICDFLVGVSKIKRANMTTAPFTE